MYTPDMRHESSDPASLPFPPGMPSSAAPTIQCPVTHLEVGDSLEEAQRYAETIAARLEAAIEALEALGSRYRVIVLRDWLERWLGIVEVLFEARLEERQALFGTQA
jgi:hypothetical protein